MRGMELLEEEIEEVVGSPEVEGFRELKDWFVYTGLLGDQEGEHHDVEAIEEVEFRHLEESSRVVEAVVAEGHLKREKSRDDKAETEGEEFLLELVLERRAEQAEGNE